MNKYMLLYHGGNGAAQTAEEGAKLMGEWQAWFGQMGAALVDMGNQFGTGQIITDAQGTLKAAEAGQNTGYSIINASDVNHAQKLANACPHLKHGGMVSVYEAKGM